jgi:hypothetical protein
MQLMPLIKLTLARNPLKWMLFLTDDSHQTQDHCWCSKFESRIEARARRDFEKNESSLNASLAVISRQSPLEATPFHSYLMLHNCHHSPYSSCHLSSPALFIHCLEFVGLVGLVIRDVFAFQTGHRLTKYSCISQKT